jgi:hypothetical protein
MEMANSRLWKIAGNIKEQDMSMLFHNGAERKVSPLLMVPPLVRQTRAGVKTLTRRLNGLEVHLSLPEWKLAKEIGHYKGRDLFRFDHPVHGFTSVRQCPYGQKGDIIWVRETFFDCSNVKNAPLFRDVEGSWVYLSDTDFIGEHKWKPNIHMPMAACRLWLEIIDSRPVRLHSITPEDAIAEGIEPFVVKGKMVGYTMYGKKPGITSPIASFMSLWSMINGTDSLMKNQWVWRVEFKTIEKPEGWDELACKVASKRRIKRLRNAN